MEEFLCSAVAHNLDCNMVVGEFELRSGHFVYFRTNIFLKVMNPSIP